MQKGESDLRSVFIQSSSLNAVKPSFDFEKGDRLLCSADFRRVLDAGSKVVTRYFVVVAVQSPVDRARLGMITTRKIGTAVCRNRCRRVLRETFRLHRGKLDQLEIVVIVRKSATGLCKADLARLFNQALDKVAHKVEDKPSLPFER